MNTSFEAKYINIIWNDKYSAKKIVTSDESIEIEKIDTLSYQLEVISYSKVDSGQQGQFAICLLDFESKEIPYFQISPIKRVELIPFKDNITGKIWWVEGDTWDAKSNRWLSRIYRSAGQVKLHIGKIKCLINISASTFTFNELNHYLKDFKNDLWELILDDSSYIKGAGKLSLQGKIDESSIKSIRKFIKHTQAILKKPKVELREIQSLTVRNKVKPVPRTFMELSSKGDSKYLTSRSNIESLNVPENRYVHYALQRVYLLLRALTSVANKHTERLGRNVEDYKARLNNFSDKKVINKEAVEYDFNDKKKKFKNLTQNLQMAINKANSELHPTNYGNQYEPWTLFFNLQSKTNNENELKFFADVRNDESDDWFRNQAPTFVFADFNFDRYVGLINPGYEYKITGFIQSNSCENRRGAYNYYYEIVKIDTIEIVGGQQYEKLKANISLYENKIINLEIGGWEEPLTNDEKEQQAKEKLSINKLLAILSDQQENMIYLAKEIEPKLPVIKNILTQFKSANVRIDGMFPNSMSFVQNPHYQGVHTHFKIIKDLSGVDDDELLIALQRVDDIGLVNISTLYERWCLLQIIKVLIQKFQYVPEANWKKKLTKQVLDLGKNISISFSNESTQREIILWYEKELTNGKRPDFILDVVAKHHDGKSELRKRFVLDAKFYQSINDSRHGGISTVIKELYHNKNYSEDKTNAVFIIHPSLNSVPIRKTPQNWSKNSYYGEVPMFDWDDDLREKNNHEYGAICLSPVSKVNYVDELQRLIGMFLQYGVESNHLYNNDINTIPDAKAFCMVCGSDEYSYSQGQNEKVWWVTCKCCSHFTVYSYCANQICRNRLIKNGEYWTYHSMEPMQPLNIKCPSCQGAL